MKQITQKLIDGKMEIVDVPYPIAQKGHLVIKNHYSVISAGTEGSTVKAARKGYIGKAKEKPQQVKLVLDSLRTQGPTQTYRSVMKKLDTYSPLGYSCVGEVIEIDPTLDAFKIGDYVACGGTMAAHAEIVCVPANLCVKIPYETDLKQAAYNTLGAIALQGVRQADLRLGEFCAVIGLGLIGQLTALLLHASGIRVVGIDIDQAMVDFAARHCLDLALNRQEPGIEERIQQFTGGLGCDAVIVSASSDSTDPINFAGKITRKRGTIIVVGNVPTGFDREPYFYKKELQVKMSCSYGPGRYDPLYEEKGLDYPASYVRWTENRNMQAFQDLIASGKIDLRPLTTHVLSLEDAPRAYDMILEKSESYLGILIQYDVSLMHDRGRIELPRRPPRMNRISSAIGFIGAGSYAQSHLLPNLPSQSVRLGIMTTSGITSRAAAQRFGFTYCTTNEHEIFDNPAINTVFIATRHDSHATYVRKALLAGKHVFVEKPLCLTKVELDEILNDYSSQARSVSRSMFMVGYNRRYAPFSQKVKAVCSHGPISVIYRINAGSIPADSWIHDPDVGGGRIIGEVCHFVDYITFLCGSLPTQVYAAAMESTMGDTLQVILTYANGSLGAISYFTNGDRRLSKERIEVYAHGRTAVIDDFRTLTLFTGGKIKRKRLVTQDKGQKTALQTFINAVESGAPLDMTMEEVVSSSMVTFRIIDSLRKNKVMSIIS